MVNHSKLRKREQLFLKAINSRAGILRLTGKFDSCITDYQRILSFFSTKGLEGFAEILEAKINIAFIICEGKYDYRRAIKLTKEALSTINRERNPRSYANTMNVLGSIYLRMGNYERTLQCFHEALESCRKLNDEKCIGTPSPTI
jgi:tetratricopeptide (TPR) repeat protein